MNIGYYCGGLFPASKRGGIQNYVLRLIRTLGASSEHQVHLLTDSEPDHSWSPLPNVVLHIVRPRWVPGLGRWLPGLGESRDIARTMRHIVDRYALDIVEFPNWEAPGLIFTLSNPVPSVTRLSTCFAETMKIDGLPVGLGERFVRWAERTTSRRSTALVTHTGAHRRYMAQELGVPESAIALIPLGIEVPDEPLPIVDHSGGEPLQLLSVGRLEHRKGTLDLLRALPAAVAKAPPFTLTLIGRDRLHAPGGRTFRQYADQELPPDIRVRLRFKDVVSDQELDQAYRQCDLFVAPSLYESFGLTYVEAMRYGKPAIGCWAGGIPEVIRHGHTGLLVQPSQPQALADAIITLLTDPNLRLRMGRNAHAWTRENFSVQVMAERTIALYERVLDSSGGAASAVRHRSGRPIAPDP